MKIAYMLMTMPKFCGECDFFAYDKCQAIGDEVEDKYKKRDSDCPLRTLPIKKHTDFKGNNHGQMAFEDGWNACLDRIKGETE